MINEMKNSRSRGLYFKIMKTVFIIKHREKQSSRVWQDSSVGRAGGGMDLRISFVKELKSKEMRLVYC